jgi:SAM-dependent methyltransferase
VNYQDPRAFWEARLASHFDLRAAGLRRRGRRFNEWMYRARLDTLRRALRRHQVRASGKSVLDVGCGTGFYIPFWESMGATDLKGIDIAASSISALRQRFPSYSFERIDISEGAPAPTELFDIVTAFDVLYHIVEPVRFEVALANLRRSAREGGYLLVSDIFGGTDIVWLQHCLFRAHSTYTRLFDRLGITILGVYPQFALLNLPLDIRPPWLRPIVAGLTSAMTCPSVIEPVGYLIGAGLYHLDRLLLPRLSTGPSTKLMVCQVC